MRMKIGFLVVFAVVLGFSSNAMASGFALAEQSVSGLGNAFSGGAAIAEDASTVFFNPAGMTRIKGKQVMTGLHVIIPSAKFSDKGSSAYLSGTPPGITVQALTGGDGGDAGGAVAVPNLYYVETFDKGWSFGLGINVPFGLGTEYDSGWIGRYHGVTSEISTININPSAAHKLNDHFSYGFGVSIQYLDAELSNAIDFGTIDTLGTFNLAGGPFGMIPQDLASDGFTTATGDSWAFGFNLGFLYEFNEDQRVGFAYRSKISHELDGDVDWTLPSAFPVFVGTMANPAVNLFQDGGVKVDVDMPSSASLSYYGELSNGFAIMADITWTEWSVLDKLTLDYADNTTSGVTTFNWDDTMRYSVGATYDLNDKCKLRAGLAFDETPIPNEVLRGVRVPGEDRTWITLGGHHGFSDTWSLDVAYAYIIVDDAVIDKRTSTSSEDLTRGYIYGEYDATVNIISAQLNYNF